MNAFATIPSLITILVAVTTVAWAQSNDGHEDRQARGTALRPKPHCCWYDQLLIYIVLFLIESFLLSWYQDGTWCTRELNVRASAWTAVRESVWGSPSARKWTANPWAGVSRSIRVVQVNLTRKNQILTFWYSILPHFEFIWLYLYYIIIVKNNHNLMVKTFEYNIFLNFRIWKNSNIKLRF